MHDPATVALRTLERSLGESPRFSPSLAQVRDTLGAAVDLLRCTGFCREGFGCDASGNLSTQPGCGELVKFSLLGALSVAGAGIGPTVHVHAGRFLRALLGLHVLEVETRRGALDALKRGARLLGRTLPYERRGGWTVSAGVPG